MATMSVAVIEDIRIGDGLSLGNLWRSAKADGREDLELGRRGRVLASTGPLLLLEECGMRVRSVADGHRAPGRGRMSLRATSSRTPG